MEKAKLINHKRKGSLTLLSLLFLLLVTFLVGSQMIIYQNQLMTNHALIHKYNLRAKKGSR